MLALHYNHLQKIKFPLLLQKIHFLLFMVNEQCAFQNRIFYRLWYAQKANENEIKLQNNLYQHRIYLKLIMMQKN